MTDPHARRSDFRRRRSPRLRAFDYPAQFAYSITVCTKDRFPYFADEAVGREVARCLDERAAQSGYRLVCYCVMPDHVHILTAPGNPGRARPLPQFIRQFKSGVTYRLGKLGMTAAIWQRSFYDHVLRKEEDLEHVATYILGNPVRKGLVQTPEAYPLSRYCQANSRVEW